jgi:fatty-acyl-CoA synthase
VRRWATLAPARTALVDAGSGRRWDYATLDAESDAWARVLAEAGVGPGDRVALLAGTVPTCVALFVGCLRARAVLVPLNWRLAAPELARVLADAAPVVLVADGRQAPLATLALAASGIVGVRTLDLDAAQGALAGAGVAPLPIPVSAAEEGTMLLYTSGSTGTPKGVILPRRQLLYNAVATTAGWQLGREDVTPVATPLFHTGGWHVFLTPMLHVGGSAVLFDGFDAEAFLHGMSEHACTVAFAVPTQLTMLAGASRWGARLPALRHIISGGAPCPPSVREEARRAGYALREGFGLTECGPNCFATSDAAAAAHPGSVGWPVPYLDMRLVDEAGCDVAVGEPGEMLLRGPQMFAGYFGAPERTAETLTDDGWLRTGDLAVRDARGLTRICGRRKEMYISGGENVFPGEVEAALSGCPGIAEVAVMGVSDPRWGEVGCAYVVPRAGVVLGATAVTAYARGVLAGYKVPKQVVVLDALPRLGSGKVDRRALLRMPPTPLHAPGATGEPG